MHDKTCQTNSHVSLAAHPQSRLNNFFCFRIPFCIWVECELARSVLLPFPIRWCFFSVATPSYSHWHNRQPLHFIIVTSPELFHKSEHVNENVNFEVDFDAFFRSMLYRNFGSRFAVCVIWMCIHRDIKCTKRVSIFIIETRWCCSTEKLNVKKYFFTWI